VSSQTNPCKKFLGVARNNLIMTKTKTYPDLLEIAAMRARWKEERAAGATGETFARWRLRVRAKVDHRFANAANSHRIRTFGRSKRGGYKCSRTEIQKSTYAEEIAERTEFGIRPPSAKQPPNILRR
jgi:hypothetical protein